MTAGSGIRHSEFNPSATEELRLLQIWFIPNKPGLTPSYEQKKFSHEDEQNKFLKVVSGAKEDGVIFINQDAVIYLSDLDKGKQIKHQTSPKRGVYVHVIEGATNVNGQSLNGGDAAKLTEEKEIIISAETDSKIILFDMTMDF